MFLLKLGMKVKSSSQNNKNKDINRNMMEVSLVCFYVAEVLKWMSKYKEKVGRVDHKV